MLVCWEEVAWYSEGVAVDFFSDADVVGFLWRGSESKQDPRKLLCPVAVPAGCCEGCFEGAVEALDYAVHLRVITGGVCRLHAYFCCKLLPQGRGELGPSVAGDDVRNAKAPDPAVEKCCDAVCCR